jgi:hypothetical protein
VVRWPASRATWTCCRRAAAATRGRSRLGDRGGAPRRAHLRGHAPHPAHAPLPPQVSHTVSLRPGRRGARARRVRSRRQARPGPVPRPARWSLLRTATAVDASSFASLATPTPVSCSTKGTLCLGAPWWTGMSRLGVGWRHW